MRKAKVSCAPPPPVALKEKEWPPPPPVSCSESKHERVM